jgi:hypothetical protein
MSALSLITDEYEHRARLRPALLVSLPLALAAASWYSDFPELKIIIGFAVYCGFAALLAQLGRDQGKKKEPRLFAQWGGKPTTQVLRHRDRHLDATTKERYHRALDALVPGMHLPSPETEAANPDDADAKYDSCVTFLREKTRDSKAFPLVFAENVNYGFRRNLWGMKPAGIALSAVALVGSCIAAVINRKEGVPPLLPMLASFVNGLLLVWWIFRINPAWVRVPAFAYAERLLATCDLLRAPEGETKQRIITT